MNEQLKLVKIFNADPSFNVFWNTKKLSNNPQFNGVCSRNNLSRIKDGTYTKNLDEYESIGNHWIVLYVNVCK